MSEARKEHDGRPKAGGHGGDQRGAAVARMEERGVARTEAGALALREEAALDEIDAAAPDGTTVSIERRALFLRELMRSPVVGRAARQAGLTLRTVYALRKADRRFSAAWDEAMSCAVDELEQAAVDRALDKSDKLLEILLKAKRPEQYRERIEHAVAVGGTITVNLVPMNDEQ